jgi:peptidoglycan/xylan/chitin deacetylase (PgdA/CDA1 family)
MIHSLLSFIYRLLSRNKLTILNYHQVLEVKDNTRPGEPDKHQFEWQMRLINKYFNPLSINQALVLLRENKLPPRSVCVTIDDGYLNNLTIAQPILAKYSIPSTVYVASAFSNGDNMFNDRVITLVHQCQQAWLDLSAIELPNEKLTDTASRRILAHKIIMAIKYLPIERRSGLIDELYQKNGDVIERRLMMTPDEVKMLSDKGVDIACHTHNHPILKGMSADEASKEIAVNKALLEQWLNKPITGFAYPNGRPHVDFDEKTVTVLKTLNFDYAVTTQAGFSQPNFDRFRLPRFTPWDSQPWKFHARMSLNLLVNK